MEPPTRICTYAMFAAIFALSVAFGQSPAPLSSTPPPSIAAQVTVSPIPEWKDDPLLGQVNLPALVKIVRQSVVQIFGYRSGKIVQTGSGFIAEDGAVVTNFHVINGIDDAYIKLSNGARKHVLGLAYYSEGADIAVLLVPEVDGIRGLSLAPSLPEVGERIYVIGNPETFAGTLSDGLVSALRRDDYGALVQITAPISHGSSGSPVFNNGGLVIGVAMGSVESGQSLNFARSAGAVRAMLQSEQGFTTLSDLNKTQAKNEQAKTGPTTSLRPTPKPRLVYASDVSDGLKRFISGYAAKSPDNKFHMPYQRKDLALDLVKLHDDRFSNLGGDEYFACVDMKSVEGKLYDIDFFMSVKPGKLTVTETSVHKINGKPLYNWKQEGGVWKKVKV